MKYELLQITNERAFLIITLQQFMLKALATSKIIPDAEAALLEISDLLATGYYGLFVTHTEKNEFVGMALAENSPMAMAPGCLVLHFYNKGGIESRKLLIQAVINFAKLGGQTKIRGFDANDRPKGFARLFKAAGPAKPLGQVFEFSVGN